jgi:hypothetical protein
MTDQNEHEKCECGCADLFVGPAGIVSCNDAECYMRASSWDQWDRVMRAARDVEAGTCTECHGPIYHRRGHPGEYDHQCARMEPTRPCACCDAPATTYSPGRRECVCQEHLLNGEGTPR